jgi:hypothetical protein
MDKISGCYSQISLITESGQPRQLHHSGGRGAAELASGIRRRRPRYQAEGRQTHQVLGSIVPQPRVGVDRTDLHDTTSVGARRHASFCGFTGCSAQRAPRRIGYTGGWCWGNFFPTPFPGQWYTLSSSPCHFHVSRGCL